MRQSFAQFVCILSLCSLVIAQTPVGQTSVAQMPTAKKDPTAVSIVASSLAAMGTGAATSSAAIVEGAVTFSDGSSQTVTTKSIGFDRVRHELSGGKNIVTHVTNQGDGYTLIGSTRRTLPLWDATRGQEHIPAFTRMADYQNAQLSRTAYRNSPSGS